MENMAPAPTSTATHASLTPPKSHGIFLFFVFADEPFNTCEIYLFFVVEENLLHMLDMTYLFLKRDS